MKGRYIVWRLHCKQTVFYRPKKQAPNLKFSFYSHNVSFAEYLGPQPTKRVLKKSHITNFFKHFSEAISLWNSHCETFSVEFMKTVFSNDLFQNDMCGGNLPQMRTQVNFINLIVFIAPTKFKKTN